MSARTTTNPVDPQRASAARKLARNHLRVEPNLQRVFLLDSVEPTSDRGPIALLEIVDGTIERGVEPVAFAPDPARGVRYPSVIVEVSPREFKNTGDLERDLTTRGWRIGRELATR